MCGKLVGKFPISCKAKIDSGLMFNKLAYLI